MSLLSINLLFNFGFAFRSLPHSPSGLSATFRSALCPLTMHEHTVEEAISRDIVNCYQYSTVHLAAFCFSIDPIYLTVKNIKNYIGPE
jgi:hypothetical protein